MGTPEKKLNFLISKGLGHLWPELQLVFNVGLTNKGLDRSSSEFAPIPRAGPSRVQIV